MEGHDQDQVDQEGSMMQEIYKSIVQLNRERLECEKTYQFVEAGKIKDHLTKLGEEYVRVSLHLLREKQQSEKDGLESEYEKEIDNLNGKWEERLQKHEEETQHQYEEIRERQQQEMEQLQEHLQKSAPTQIKMSPEILNLEYQISVLVKDQRYNEAAIVQKKLAKLKDKAVEKGHGAIDESLRNKLEAANKKRENELIAIEKRLNSLRDQLFREKDSEFDQLNSRFKVYREKLENNHVNEFIKEEKRLKGFNPYSKAFAEME
jgi:ElaB/YqjD/DUF883 family membrane-anchored ribosome-binding protein